MYWIILVAGVALWWAAHLFKRIAPERRAAMGDPGKGAVAIGVVLSIVLMVIGYRGVDFINVWFPPSFTIHINNLAMLIAIYLFSPAPKRGKLVSGMRHPMLTGFSIWAIAHLLVNGDLASIILFGGLLIWAIATARIINAAEPDWQRGPQGTLAKDAMFFVGSIILLAIIGWIHNWLGVWPFPS
ncbi:NnrU family protein [Tateyamaria sp. ANG-S1]|uniref:NnrU family protein n=1 Tax=Tateyamaria sp. ANG-S1 TaxID=1577905 RepID=UPI000580A9FD|nr:NnrU family protein [Tateyamaria sp. ANG-S1]KIC51270.1 membrane protein [Tateyamaria sp. ANG-S1]